jgi:hypothetical protein
MLHLLPLRQIGFALLFAVGLVSFAFAQSLGNFPPGCQSVSTQLAKGKMYHGAKCNFPSCTCGALLCKRHGKFSYSQVECQMTPQ